MSFWDGLMEQIKAREGGIDKFLDDLIKKQGLDTQPTIVDTRQKHKHMTVDDLINKLKDIRKIQGGEVYVYADDSSGYEYSVRNVTVDHDLVVITG